jgi:hypothetical protein
MITPSIKVLAVSCLILNSCNKLSIRGEEENLPIITSEQFINISADQKMSITLPTEGTKNRYIITQNSKYAKAQITDNTVNITAPSILPEEIASEVVIISNDNSNSFNGGCFGGNTTQPNCGSGNVSNPSKGNCGTKDNKPSHHKDAQQNYIVKLTIKYLKNNIHYTQK